MSFFGHCITRFWNEANGLSSLLTTVALEKAVFDENGQTHDLRWFNR